MKRNIVIIWCILSVCIYSLSGNADTKVDILKSVKKGSYTPDRALSLKDLRYLPIPESSQNYAFMQSIDAITSVVIGDFVSGDRIITLIQDKNSDGTVDLVVYWYVDTERFRYDANPAKTYSQENFKKLKDDIIRGVQGKINPNEEGLSIIEKLYQGSGNIQRWRNGFRVTSFDPDDIHKERLNYYFSVSADGADLVFEVIYVPRNNIRVSPVINEGVYCKNSKDPYINEITKKLIEDTRKVSP